MSQSAEALLAELGEAPLMGVIKKKAKEIKKDHELAYELWATRTFTGRMLAALIFDKIKLRGEPIVALAEDLTELKGKDESEQRDYICDWLLANQISKDSKLKIQILDWQDKPSPVLQRWYWYHQARLRWTGKNLSDTPNIPLSNNSEQLVTLAEERMADADPSVQWAMNFCLCWIALYEETYRERCIALAERVGIYKEQKVPKNCTPNYLPGFLEVELAKRSS